MRFYPFAELVDDDDFVFHPKHAPCDLVSVFYKKLDKATYENLETGQHYKLQERDAFNTWVSKIETQAV